MMGYLAFKEFLITILQIYNILLKCNINASNANRKSQRGTRQGLSG